MRGFIGVVLIAAVIAGCGDNIGSPGIDILLDPPGNLRALSVDSAHVRITWSASTSSSSSEFAGYAITWGSVTDTVQKTTLSYLAGPLPPGVTQFSLRSRKIGGQTSNPVAIAWAPARRFEDGSLVVYEVNVSAPSRFAGIDVGTRTTNPLALSMDPLSKANLDFYVDGQGGQPLLLRSASRFVQSWNVTVFSTETTSSPSLDTSLAAFPAEATFVLQDVLVADNTIYYAKVQGDPGEFHYVRIHIRVLTGKSFPDRGVEVRLSLQRSAGIPFASNGVPSWREVVPAHPPHV